MASRESLSKQYRKVCVPLYGDEIAPRFDLATEVWFGMFLQEEDDQESRLEAERTVILPRPSAEDLCRLLLEEGVSLLVCGGIEQEYFDYLRWKRVEVVDSVIGPLDCVKTALTTRALTPGAVLLHREEVD